MQTEESKQEIMAWWLKIDPEVAKITEKMIAEAKESLLCACRRLEIDEQKFRHWDLSCPDNVKSPRCVGNLYGVT